MKIRTLDLNIVLRDVRVVSVLLCLSLALPFLFHLIPYKGSIPIGAIFLPMYYAPLVGVILFKRHTGFITAVMAPVFNNLITGRPEGSMVGVLILEMVTFLYIFTLFTKRKSGVYKDILKAVLSYVISIFVCIVLLRVVPGFISGQNNIEVFLRALYISLPGIFMMGLITFALNRYKNSYDRS